MKVIINEKEHNYTSDYPIGWKFISKDYFKFPVEIGKHPCFIKRFEMSRSREIPGWNLLEKLKYKNEQNIPRIYNIVNVEENRKQINYVFYDYIKGATLDIVLAEGMDENKYNVDLVTLTNDLLTAFESIHKHDFWVADFCEKNIIATDTGKFFLIDVDSCQPASQPPDNGMDVNMLYCALVFKFYKDILHVNEIKPSDIAGGALNYLQMIFLILHLKLRCLNHGNEYMSDASFNNLPVLLNKIHPAFSELFNKVLVSEKKYSESLFGADEFKRLLFDNIVLPDLKSLHDNQQEEESIIGNESDKAVEPLHFSASRFIEKDSIATEVHTAEDLKPPAGQDVNDDFQNGNDDYSLNKKEESLVIPSIDKQKKISLQLSITETAYIKPLVQRPVIWGIAIFLVAALIIFFSRSNGLEHSQASNNSNKRKESEVSQSTSENNHKKLFSNDSQFYHPVELPVKMIEQPKAVDGQVVKEVKKSPGIKNIAIKDQLQVKTVTQTKEAGETSMATEPGSLVKICKAVCYTNGISGVEISFTIKKMNRTITLISGVNDLPFEVPCDVLEDFVSVTFKGNGQSESRHFQVKNIEIPELFKK